MQYRDRVVRFSISLIALVTFALLGSQLRAQTFYGSIVGTVTDNSGAVVPNATVTITNLGTNEKRTEKSNAAGEYSFVNLVPANYKVTVAAANFKGFEKTPVEVAVNTATRVDAALQVGAATETVEVNTADVPLLQTESGSLGDEVEAKQVDAMPLNGRNTMNLMDLVPGVVPQGNTLTGVAMNQGTGTGSVAWGNYQIGGGMPSQASIFIDGSPTMIMQKNSASLVPTADLIQEFQVQTSGVSPEFGRYAGGVVSMTTKSGTNQFHGTAYEYIRNKDVNANLFFNKRAGIPRGEWTQNQYGGTVGGPIWKNKAFFFFAYEQIHIRILATSATNVPTAAMVNGTQIPEVYSSSGVLQNKNVTDLTGNCNITHTPGTAAAPGYWTITNLYQGACGDTTAKLFATFYPTTPKNPTAQTNWNAPYSEGDDGYQMSGRVDYDITHNQRFFARFTLWPLNDESPDIVGIANPSYNTSGDASHNHTNNIVTGDTITLNPTTVLDIRADYLRQYGDSVPPGYGNVNEANFGTPFAAIAPLETYHNIPGFSFAGSQVHNLFGCGCTGNNASWSYSGLTKMYYNNYHLSASLTKILGTHSLKFGAEVRDLNREDIGSANSGTFTFNADIDTPSGSVGDEWAQFLMGEFDASSVSSAKATTTYNWYAGFYAADAWQMNKKLTLSYGLRLELPGAYAVSGNNAYVLLPAAQDPVTGLTGTLLLVNTSAYTPIYTITTESPQWGPRLGFAYRLTENTVFRGGYSLSYLPRDTQTGVFGSQMSINSTTSGNTNLSGQVPSYIMDSNAFAYPNNNPANAEGMAVAAGRANTNFMFTNLQNGTAISGPYPNEPFPHAQAMNVSFGHQFRGETLVDIGLDHELGTHLPSIGTGGANVSLGIDQLPDKWDYCGVATTSSLPSGCPGYLTTALTGSSQLVYDGVTLPKALQTVGQTLRPYPYYKNFSNSAPYYGTSSYNALELKVQKRFGATGQIGGAYTWMKMITDTDSFLASQDSGGEGVYQDLTNLKAERGLYSSNTPQRLVINYVLNLPFGQGQRFGGNANPVLSRVISGWTASGITSFASGIPLHLVTGGNKLSSTYGAGTIRPNYTAGCSKTVGGSAYARSLPGATWFNTACFADPNTPGVSGPGNTSSFGFGNEPRTDGGLTASGVNDFDFSVDKNTTIHEQMALKFTVEFYNLFNRVQFSPPVNSSDNSLFGQVTSQANFPRLVQGALRFSF